MFCNNIKSKSIQNLVIQKMSIYWLTSLGVMVQIPKFELLWILLVVVFFNWEKNRTCIFLSRNLDIKIYLGHTMFKTKLDIFHSKLKEFDSIYTIYIWWNFDKTDHKLNEQWCRYSWSILVSNTPRILYVQARCIMCNIHMMTCTLY